MDSIKFQQIKKINKWLTPLEILEDPNMANYNHTIIQTQTLK